MQTAESTAADKVLSERARHGVRGAFDALVVKHQGRAYRLAWRMTGSRSDAEEIVQEAFLRAYQAMGTFRGDSRFGTWLFRIVVNEALMRRRAASRRPAFAVDGQQEDMPDVVTGISRDPVPGAEELIDERRIAGQVRQALDLLDDSHRAALVLCDLEGLSSEEAGRILGVEPEAVRQRAHRARLKLRGLLGHLTRDFH